MGEEEKEQKVEEAKMSRNERRPPAQQQRQLEPQRKICIACEQPMWAAYQQRHNYAAYCSHRKRLLAQLQGLRW